MSPRAHPYLWCLFSVLCAFVLSVALGPVAIPFLEVARILVHALGFSWIAPDWPAASQTIVLEIRLPAAVLLTLTGAALGASGAAYQGLLRNPLADPFLIGVAPGAGLGAMAAMIWDLPVGFFGLSIIPAAAFLGAMGTIAAVYCLARVGRSTPVTTLLLAGVAVGSFASAATSFLMLATQRDLRRVVYFMLGGFGIGGWSPVLAVLPQMALGLGILLVLSRSLNVLQFGDEQAAQMGLHVERVKLAVVLAASLVAASAVAFSGIIGFVGLVVPHLARMIWGPDYRRLVPVATILGASVLLLADVAARGAASLVSAPAAAALHQMPVGVVTAFLGAPFFLVLLRRVRQSYW